MQTMGNTVEIVTEVKTVAIPAGLSFEAFSDWMDTQAAAQRRADLIAEAGRLNNHRALVNVDHVTIMGLMDADECETHVAKLRSYIDRFEQTDD